MASFRERIELTVDVITGASASSLGKLRTEIQQTDGAFGKLRVAGGGALDLIRQNAGALALGAGVALVGFGAQAVGAFQDVALGAGKLRDSLGITAEEASKLQEMAGDLGIDVGALESSMGRMNRTAASTPEAFDAIGASIVRNRDGTVNVTQTFLSAVDALNRIPDATQRAEAAQKIFGRGWQNIAEVVAGGADQMREALNSVETGKIMSDADITRARKFRDTMDDLRGVFEEASVAAGEVLVPALSAAGDALTGGLKSVKALAEAFGGVDVMMEQFGKSLGMTNDWLYLVSPLMGTLRDQIAGTGEELTGTYLPGIRSAADFGGGEFSDSLTSSADAAGEQRDALAEAKAAVDAHREALEAQAVALQEQADAMRASVDAGFALRDAEAQLRDSVTQANEVLSSNESTLYDAQAALDNVAQSAIAVADAEVRQAEETANVEGRTLSASGRVDAFNGSLIRQASQLDGPTRNAILGHIGQLNGIPEQEMTDIIALIAEGKIQEAESRLREVSRRREAEIRAEATNTAAADAALDRIARLRTAQISAQVTGARTMGAQLHTGGLADRSKGPYVIGRDGAEELWWPDSFTGRTGRVTSTEDSKRIMDAGRRDAPVTINVNATTTDLAANIARAVDTKLWRDRVARRHTR